MSTQQASAPAGANASQAAQGSRLKFFPVSFFAVTMGLSGLTLAWRKVAALLHWPVMVSHALGLFTLAIFAVLLAVYLAKLARYPEAARNELNHPVMSAFVPTISISMLLLSVCMLPLWPTFSTWLWALGTALHLILTLHIVRSWIDREHFQLGHINPAWFIPAVGNVVVPLAGAQLGQVELSWFFFAVGISFWIILLVIVFYRILFHDPLPPNLLPTLFILIAPPAVGFLAYLGLSGGQVDAFARILYYLALFFTLLLVIEFPRFARLPFFLSWWAYSFPSAAVTVATFTMAEKVGGAFFHWLALGMLAALTLLIAWLLVKTVQAAARGKICVAPKG